MTDEIDIPKTPINTQLIHKGDLSDIEDLLIDMQQLELSSDPVTLAIRIKRTQEQLEQWRRSIVGLANQCFVMLKAQHPGKMWNVAGAKLVEYAPQGTWEWPPEVAAKIAEAEAAKAAAKENKTAKFSPGKLGADTFAFKVSFAETANATKNPRRKVECTPVAPVA